MPNHTIGFGGSCHWCTEAIFQSLIGVAKVDQGWIASKAPNDSYSEAVFLTYDPTVISLETLIEVHLYTHSCTSEHSMRGKYRSAVYYVNAVQKKQSIVTIHNFQNEFDQPIITKVIPFKEFKLNDEQYLNYYKRNAQKPFCENYISPKLAALRSSHAAQMK